MKDRQRTIYLPIYLAVVFHFFGVVGMHSGFREWFLLSTPFTLLLMAVMIALTMGQRSRQFWLFLVLCYVTGYTVEWIGVNTGLLFGDYSYGAAMGPKVWAIPLIIGIQWFVVIWSTGHLTVWLFRLAGVSPERSLWYQAAAILLGALLTTGFDVALEPAAIALGYWQWYPDNVVPFFNYLCWFLVSGFLLTPFVMHTDFHKEPHPFAIALGFIQCLFFLFVV